jgi:hypothetical protein
MEASGRICGCLRYLDETTAGGFEQLWVRHAALARSPAAREFRDAVERELGRARGAGLRFGEVGGWAVAEHCRGSLEPLRIVLATYGLLELLGGCAGVATATVRHHSASILRRIGLARLDESVPPYYDPRYGCEMEILRFDSRFPAKRYRSTVDVLTVALARAEVICAGAVPERRLPLIALPPQPEPVLAL